MITYDDIIVYKHKMSIAFTWKENLKNITEKEYLEID